MTEHDDRNGNLGSGLAVGELRAVIMGDGAGGEQLVTLAAKVPDGVLVHEAEQAQVGFLPGLIVVREESLSVPILVLFIIVNQHFDPPCDLAVNVTDANSAQVLERLMAQDRLHLLVSDTVGSKAMVLGGNPVSRRMLPGLIEHARRVAPPQMPHDAFWNVTRAVYSAFGGGSGLLALFSNLINDGQELPIHTFQPSDLGRGAASQEA
ncbi:MAG: hypothetical protein HZA24_11995 [Nitrospirae bacterium]|nr:hypothetical protein [Nitrospirota bacterium]